MLALSKTDEYINHLVLTDSYLPHSGGSRVYYANIYNGIVDRYKDTVTIATTKVPGWQEFDRTAITDRFHIIRRFEPLQDWKYEQLPKAIPQLIHASGVMLAGDYHCLHCGDLFPQAFNGVFLRGLFHVPLIVFCHGDEISQTDRRRYQPKVRDFIYRRADAIIAANQFACDGLRRIGIASSRIHKLTPGVDRAHFHPEPRNQELIRKYDLSGKKVILTVARLIQRKGHRVVLKALPKVLREVPDVKYLIAGDGPDKPGMEQLVRDLGVSGSVIFLGDVPHERIHEYYSLCDVFVMINRLERGGDVESFGMVFTEANAMGKPVIGGRSGGTAESVLDGQTGLLVEPDDSDEVAQSIRLLLTNCQLAQQMGANGLRRVVAEFNWESRGRALRQISAELVQNRRSRM